MTETRRKLCQDTLAHISMSCTYTQSNRLVIIIIDIMSIAFRLPNLTCVGNNFFLKNFDLMFALLLTVILFKNGLSFLNKNVFDILGMVETYFILKCLLRPGVVPCNSQLKQQNDWIMEYVTYVKFLFTLTNATLCKLHTVRSEFRS